MVEALVGEGFLAVKLHACGDVTVDVESCRLAREVAPNTDLMMDAMAIYSRHEALALGRALDAHHYRWYEDPLPDDDLDGWRELRTYIETPLAGVDAVRFTTRDYARPMADGAFDIVRMDAARQGITLLSDLSKVADAFGLGCEGHAFGPALSQAANLQAALAAGNAEYCELPVPVGALDFGVKGGLTLSADGYVEPSGKPGLGMDVDEAVLAGGIVK